MKSPVCLVISAYRSDEAIRGLLESVAAVVEPPWSRVLVVDSLGSGFISKLIEERGWGAWAEYRSYDTNLGSAGNLSTRLRLAAEQGFEFAYAVNHDGIADPEIVRALLAYARTRERTRLGAVYPLRRYSNRQGLFDVTGTSRLPLPFRGSRCEPACAAFKVHWSSSNGALYSLDRVREGHEPWADFWLGWEDLAYGWLLGDLEYEQWVVTAAVLTDDYEYRTRGRRFAQVTVTDKPSWYSYYHARNLILAVRRTKSGFMARSVVAARIALEAGLALALRDEKADRLRLLAQGVRDGFLGRAGKGPVP